MSSRPAPTRYPVDVIVAGAGPAGLACGIAAASRGLRVEIIDAMQPPIDKACGEGLMPGSLEALAAIGFTDLHQSLSRIETHLLRGIRFVGAKNTAEAAFPSAPGRGIRRTILHQLLLDRATSLGVRFHWQNSVQEFTKVRKGVLVHTNRQTLSARYLVGADGPRSRVAAWAGLTDAVVHSRRIGLRQRYTIAPWTDFVEIHWSDYGQAYVTPNSSNEVCVAFIANKKISSPAEAMQHFPMLAEHLATAQLSGRARGSVTLNRRLRRVTAHNVALIGDASGSVDAITGEGLALCFRQAAALSQALQAGKLSRYQRAHSRIQRFPSIMARSLLLMDRSPLVRDLAINLFDRHPSLFSGLLNIHVGHTPMRPFRLPGSSLDSTTLIN